ncbi:unnamed protein product, partial [Closterium sp. NIES-54]
MEAEEVWEQQARQQGKDLVGNMRVCSGEGVISCLNLLHETEQETKEEGVDSSSSSGSNGGSGSSSSSRRGKRPVVALLWLAGSHVAEHDWQELLAEVNGSGSLRLLCADGSCSDIRLDSLCWLLPPGSLWLRQHRTDDVAWLAGLMARHILMHTWNISLPLAQPPPHPHPPPLAPQNPLTPPSSSHSPSAPLSSSSHSSSSPPHHSSLPLSSLEDSTSSTPFATSGLPLATYAVTHS